MEMSDTDISHYLILDFEATCHENNGKVKLIKHPEIIEFPVVLLNGTSLKEEDEFHFYIKPKINPQLTDFCTKFTGIKQEWVDKGIVLDQALSEFDEWMKKTGLIIYEENHLLYKRNFAFVTSGDWDLGQMLPGQCKREKLKMAEYFGRRIDINAVFSQFYKVEVTEGMIGMLKFLRLELMGHHHSGIDDCRNISKIMQKMLQDGCVFVSPK